ncbi:MAG TPA: histidine phosphatase family protein [Geminicoccaceae bacterium]|nr:histidine phosphatase family protein [Geminicoccaceae bacterium]
MQQVIYFVRHGETTWNLEGRMQGHLDAPLTVRGLREARRDGAALRALIERDAPYALVFSPLGRTRETARIVAEETRPHVHAERSDARLREVSWGEWDGLTIADIKARYPELWQAHVEDRWNIGAPGGECYRVLCERVADWLASVRDEPRLIVVSHGALGRALRGIYLGLKSDETLQLAEPQDALFRLAQGTVTTIPTGPVPDKDRAPHDRG